MPVCDVVAEQLRAKKFIKDFKLNQTEVVVRGAQQYQNSGLNHGVAARCQGQNEKGEIVFANLRTLFAFMGLILVSCLSGAGGVFAAEAPAAPTYRVVFAVTVDDQHIWNEVFGNFRNIQRALGPQNVAIEMVVYGDAISMLRDDSMVDNKVEQALEEGVKIVACENTMKAQNISRDNMLPNIGYVPAGIVELIKLQAAGWAYIRP